MMARAYELRTAKVVWKVIARELDVNLHSLRVAMKRAGIPMEGHRAVKATPEILERVHQMKAAGKMCWWRIEQDTGVSRHTIRKAYDRWVENDFKIPGVKAEYL